MNCSRVRVVLPGAIVTVLFLASAQVAHDRGPAVRPGSENLHLVEVAQGLGEPIDLASPVGDPRLFVASASGQILVIESGIRVAEPFLDLSTLVFQARGLMSLAFHPEYAANGRFFVTYIDPTEEVWLVEYTVTADPNIADPSSARVLIGPYPQIGNQHNWNCVRFGPDGKLYVATGDGGASHTNNNGQDLTTLNGKILRLDVDLPSPFVPVDNPLVGVPGVREEIFAYGLRQPWRISFDRATGDLYIADVGNNSWEEINVIPAGVPGPLNFGWRCKEGLDCTSFDCCDSPSFVDPIHVFDHADGHCAVIGAEVYNGTALPWLRGAVLTADYCTGNVWSMRYDGSGVTDIRDHSLDFSPGGPALARPITSISSDSDGELYLLDLSGGGQVYQLVPRAASRYCVATVNSGGGSVQVDVESSLSVSRNEFTLAATQGIPGTFGIFFYGESRVRVPFGEGFRCIGGELFRLQPPVLVDPAGRATRPYDLTRPPKPEGQVRPGDTWHFQFWYRDAPAGGSGFNLSDGISVTFCP